MNGPLLHARPSLGRMFFPFSTRIWFGVKDSRSLGSSETFVRLLFRIVSTSQNSVCKPSSSNTFAKGKTRPSTRTLWIECLHIRGKWKQVQCMAELFWEKMDIWILTCDAGKTEMDSAKKKLLFRRHRPHCWCYSFKRIMDDGSSSEYKVWLPRIGPN